jgi:hypothetical protein
LANVFQPENAEFLLLKVEPFGKAIVTPGVSDLDGTVPDPPFALKESVGFELVGVV